MRTLPRPPASNRYSQSGFTLVEVLISIGLLLFMALGAATYMQQSGKSAVARRATINRDAMVEMIRKYAGMASVLRASITSAPANPQNAMLNNCLKVAAPDCVVAGAVNTGIPGFPTNLHTLALWDPTTSIWLASSNITRYNIEGTRLGCADGAPASAACPWEVRVWLKPLCEPTFTPPKGDPVPVGTSPTISNNATCAIAETIEVYYDVRQAVGFGIGNAGSKVHGAAATQESAASFRASNGSVVTLVRDIVGG